MEAELEEKLGYEKNERLSKNDENSCRENYRNGYSKKTVKTQPGEVEVKIPRDRNGEYEPQIIGKYNRNADGMEEKILGLYSCGMSQRDIAEQIKNLYDVEISDGLVSKIVEKVTPEINAWQNRPLESVYFTNRKTPSCNRIAPCLCAFSAVSPKCLLQHFSVSPKSSVGSFFLKKAIFCRFQE